MFQKVYIIQTWPGGIIREVLSDKEVASNRAVQLDISNKPYYHTVIMREVDSPC